MTSSTDRLDDAAEWPYATLFFFGSFGTHTPAGRRLRRESGLSLAVVVAGIILVNAQLPVPVLIGAIGLALGVAGMGWSYSRYLGSLDELGRLMQLKAFSFSYGAVMTLAAALTGAWRVVGGGTIDPLAFLVVLVLAEPLRGVALVVLARRYR